MVELNEDEEFFYQSVSHGLKTPIMVIQNCCAAYQDGHLRLQEAIDIIMKESLAVEAGIRKLLYVSSFDHMLGKQSDFRPVELRGLMEECRRRFRATSGVSAGGGLPAGLTVSGNAAALQTVFDNLVENGLRYAASYIRMELTGEEEGGYLLTVENDGAPIPQPTLNVLFQKFYKGADGNFGLGLYIAKDCAVSQGGHLGLQLGRRSALSAPAAQGRPHGRSALKRNHRVMNKAFFI